MTFDIPSHLPIPLHTFWYLITPFDTFFIASNALLVTILTPSDTSSDRLIPLHTFWYLSRPSDTFSQLLITGYTFWYLLRPTDTFPHNFWYFVTPSDASSYILIPSHTFWYLLTPHDSFSNLMILLIIPHAFCHLLICWLDLIRFCCTFSRCNKIKPSDSLMFFLISSNIFWYLPTPSDILSQLTSHIAWFLCAPYGVNRLQLLLPCVLFAKLSVEE